MKFETSSTVLAERVKMLSKVINPQSTLPILTNIYCKVKGNGLTLIASDADVTVSTEVLIKDVVEKEFSFCTTASNIINALSQLSEQPVIFDVDMDNLKATIYHMSGQTFFAIFSGDEFPVPELKEYENKMLNIEATVVNEAIKRSLWATSKDDLRPQMAGLCFNAHDNNLDIVATDGFVLVKTEIPTGDDTNGSFIMPSKAASLLQAMTPDENSLDILWDDKQGRIEMSYYDLNFRLIEGKYPNYNSVIPTDQPITATVSRGFLANSMKKVVPFSQIRSESRMVCMKFETGKLTLEAQDFDFQAGAEDHFPIQLEGCESISIGVNGTATLAILSKLSGQEVVMCMTDPSRAIVFTPKEQPEDCNITMLQMPMMLNQDE